MNLKRQLVNVPRSRSIFRKIFGITFGFIGMLIVALVVLASSDKLKPMISKIPVIGASLDKMFNSTKTA
jgi:hypothetical protein